MIADLDTSSKAGGNVWRSYLMKGYLSYSPAKQLIDVTWDTSEPIEIQSSYSLKGRGMELSELVVFNGKLLSFDDRTGFIYEIDHDQAIPWVLLMDGAGRSRKGFKAEWATVKDQILYVGSMGKEWTTSMGDFENNDPMYVKAVTMHGEVGAENYAYTVIEMKVNAIRCE
jgi:soluble calcium-activated nucleotidase 1